MTKKILIGVYVFVSMLFLTAVDSVPVWMALLIVLNFIVSLFTTKLIKKWN